MYGYRSPRSDLNPNYGGCSTYPRGLQAPSRPGDESYSIDFSQSLTHILLSRGHNLNTNPKEGLNVISTCTDTWKETMNGWHNKQEKMIQGLKHQLHMMNNAFKELQLSFGKLQEDFKKLDKIVYRHEVIIPKLREDVGTLLRKVNSILAEVDK